jgi:hypothetical protein
LIDPSAPPSTQAVVDPLFAALPHPDDYVPGSAPGVTYESYEAISEPDMVEMVRLLWGDPVFRQDLIGRETPERILGLLLQTAGARNADSSAMSVSDFLRRVVEEFAAVVEQLVAAAPPEAPSIP